MSEQNGNLIKFIAATVETMREQMATKDDLMQLEVRLESRMENMRGDLEMRMNSIERRMDSIEGRLESMEGRMVTKDELDLKLGILATTIKGDFEQVHLRFDTLERVMDTRFGQVETDISRIRSVVYLLVKDKPDMLRLLGQPTTQPS